MTAKDSQTSDLQLHQALHVLEGTSAWIQGETSPLGVRGDCQGQLILGD
jgi:hypothetical protein